VVLGPAGGADGPTVRDVLVVDATAVVGGVVVVRAGARPSRRRCPCAHSSTFSVLASPAGPRPTGAPAPAPSPWFSAPSLC